MTAKRVTIMIDSDNSKFSRSLQAKLIQKSPGSVSFSRVINEMLKQAYEKKLDKIVEKNIFKK